MKRCVIYSQWKMVFPIQGEKEKKIYQIQTKSKVQLFRSVQYLTIPSFYGFSIS